MSWLDHAYARVLNLKSRWESPRRWSRAGSRNGIRVDYGYDHIPEKGQFLSGGLVKVQDLQTLFPNERSQPNLLYLVSSALPHDAVIQAEAARKAGGVVVLNQNGVGYPGWHGPGWEKFNRPMQRIHALADFVVYQSAFCRAGAEAFLGKRTGLSSILHNPVDTSVFVPAQQPPAKGPVLLLAGTHQFRYRVETAVQTLARVAETLQDAKLHIAGQHTWMQPGPAQEEIMIWAKSLGVEEKVVLLPPYAQNEAVELMQGSHILLHTKYNDPCPRLVVEAMACGLPVVYSATGGMPELIGEDGGVGVPGPHDTDRDHPPPPDGLARCVVEVWEKYGGYRAAAREHAVGNLDVQDWLDAHGRIFAELVGDQV